MCDFNSFKRGYIKHKIRISNIIFLSLLISIYAIFSFPKEFIGDHFYYFDRFVNNISIESESKGLDFLWRLIHNFTNNGYIMFFVVIFIATFLVLFAYRCFDDAHPLVIVVLLSSEFFVYGFAALKQYVANAFAFCFFAYFFKNKKIRSIIFIVLAILFHEAAYILVPIFIILCFSKKSTVMLVLSAIGVFLVPVFIDDILRIFQEIVPSMSEQLERYLTDDGSLIEKANFLTILKGIPIYCITFFGILKYNVYSKKIKHYNQYLVLCIIASASILMSFYMYWFFRISYLMLLPIYFFGIKLYHCLTDQKEKILYFLVTFVLLGGLTIKYIVQMFVNFGGL